MNALTMVSISVNTKKRFDLEIDLMLTKGYWILQIPRGSYTSQISKNLTSH